MKTLRHLTLAASLLAALILQGNAFAEDIGGGSVRLTAAPESGAEIKIRYLTEDGAVEKTLPGSEVLHLSTFQIVDNGGGFPLLQPASNQFNLYKGETTTGFVIMGNPDNDLVRLSFEQEGTQVPLQLDFQWTPKLEILTSPADKVEVLSEWGDLLHEVGELPLFLSSDNGMAIRFVVTEPEAQGGEAPEGNQGAVGEDGDAAPQNGSAGGCSLTAGSSTTMSHAWLLLLPATLAAARRIRRK